MPDDPGRQFGDLEPSAEDLYERAPCAFLSTLPDGKIVRANTTFFDWLGRSRDDIVGRVRFQELLSMGARIYYETHYAPLLQMQGFVNEIALEIRRADGSLRPVVASARQMRDAAGAVKIHRVALFDSTDRRRYERELLDARRRAEQAAQQLSEADREKNEFIALLAHELRNPLAPIRAGVEIFRRSDDKSDLLSKTTSMMERQVAQIARLVEDLLDISRIGQNKLSLHRGPVDLRSVVQHAIEMSEPLLQNAGLTFAATVWPTAIHVSADAPRLAQAIGNILNNAAKFTPHGGAVSLRLERDDDGAVIRVRDTGIGIEPAELSRIFELFVQAETALDRPEGLGIGLSLAKSLVERHEGHLTVHSAGRGQGAEFTIRLPVLIEVPEAVRPTISSAERQVQPSPKRVLVVDDNHDAAEMIALLLGFGGHDVRVAHDGLAAVALSAELQPDVVLLDIGLPRLNGYEAAQRIQKQSGLRPVLVALTGWSQDEDRRKSAAAGFDVHLVKPVDHEALIELVDGLPSMPSRS
jgi:PAS domain S-box-containing protein